MVKKILLYVLLLLFSLTRPSFAFDWKTLHEQADKITLAQATAKAAGAPDSKDELYLLGLVYLNLYRDKEAQGVFEKIIALDPRSIPARWGAAEVLRRKHAVKEADEKLAALIKEDPAFSPASISLAYLRFTQTDFRGSVDLAKHVLTQGAQNTDTSNYVRAYLLVAAGKGMLAHYGGFASKLINGTVVYPTLKKAQALQPEAAGVLFGLGSFYLLAPRIAGGNRSLAREYLEKAVEADPHLVDGYVRLAQAYKLAGDAKKYRSFLHKALSLDPQNEVALDIESGTCRFICVK